MRSMIPDWSFGLWRKLEGILEPWAHDLALFAKTVLVRQNS